LGFDGEVPDHSTFSKDRHGRFRDSDLVRRLFATTVARCIAEGLVGGEGFAVDASLIRADASRQHTVDRTTICRCPEARAMPSANTWRCSTMPRSGRPRRSCPSDWRSPIPRHA